MPSYSLPKGAIATFVAIFLAINGVSSAQESASKTALQGATARPGQETEHGWRRTAAGWEHTSHWRFPAKPVLSTSQWQVTGVAKFPQRMDFHPAILAFGMIAVAILAFFVWDPTRDTSAELN